MMGRSKAPRCPKCRETWRNRQSRKKHVRDHAMRRLYMKFHGSWVTVGWICWNCYHAIIEKPEKPCPNCGTQLNYLSFKCPECGTRTWRLHGWPEDEKEEAG